MRHEKLTWRGVEGQSNGSALMSSDLDLLGYGEGIIDIDAQVSNGALDLGVAEQELNGSKVPGSSVDHGRLGPPERVRAEFQRIETDAGNPLADEAGILSSRQSASRATASGEIRTRRASWLSGADNRRGGLPASVSIR